MKVHYPFLMCSGNMILRSLMIVSNILFRTHVLNRFEFIDTNDHETLPPSGTSDNQSLANQIKYLFISYVQFLSSKHGLYCIF